MNSPASASQTRCDTYSGGPDLDITVADLQALGHLMPPTARSMVRELGPAATEALIRTWPGQEIPVPRHRNANDAGARRWAQIEAVVGPEAMPRVAGAYGGSMLDIPSCKALLLEKRNRWIRRRFDELTARGAAQPGMSKREAVRDIVLALLLSRRGLTYREVEKVVDASDRTGGPAAPAPPLPQLSLPFFDAADGWPRPPESAPHLVTNPVTHPATATTE